MENRYIISAIGTIIFAILLPLGIYIFRNKRNYSTLDTLGPVGDFFGGSTIALFNIASFLMLVAAIVMQKEELSLQRKEVRATRKEYEITNLTMKKQQFDSTFFNMINLQQNILRDIKYKDQQGRDAIKALYKELKRVYNQEIYNKYSKLTIEEITNGDLDELNKFSKSLFIKDKLDKYLDDFYARYYPDFNRFGEPDTTEETRFYNEIINGQNHEWNEKKKNYIESFEEFFKDDREWFENFVIKFNLKKIAEIENIEQPNLVINFKKNFFDSPVIEYKREAYKEVYDENENIIGHYYRNLYRIIKLIQETEFDSSSLDNNEKERKKYRGILRAQLSSFELLMVFYNMVYSQKGEEFKKLVKGTNFFDDHLVEKDFIWSNDKEELEAIR